MAGLFLFLIVGSSLLLGKCTSSGLKEGYTILGPPPWARHAHLSLYTVGREETVEGLVSIPKRKQSLWKDKGQFVFVSSGSRPSALTLPWNQQNVLLSSYSLAPKVKLSSLDHSSTDGYLALPDSCLGQSYRLTTLPPAPHGQAFVIIASKDKPTTVTVSSGSLLRPFNVEHNNKTYTNQTSIVLQMGPDEIQVVSSRTDSLDGLYVYGSSRIAVFAGNVNSSLGPKGQSNTLIEMIPPIEMMDREYVVVPPEGSNSTVIKVVSIYPGTNISAVSHRENQRHMYDVTMAKPGMTWTYSQGGPLLISSTHPVGVTQFTSTGIPASTAMSVILPLDQWTNSYHIHGFVDTTGSIIQSATIVIMTDDIPGFLGTSWTEDVTSQLAWKVIGSSPYSTVSLSLQATDVIWLRHLNEAVTFQVTLTGMGRKGGSYALPAGVATMCGRKDVGLPAGKAKNRRRKSVVETVQRVRRAVTGSTTIAATTPSEITTIDFFDVGGNNSTELYTNTTPGNNTDDSAVPVAVVATSAAIGGVVVIGSIAAVAALKITTAAAVAPAAAATMIGAGGAAATTGAAATGAATTGAATTGAAATGAATTGAAATGTTVTGAAASNGATGATMSTTHAGAGRLNNQLPDMAPVE